MLTFIDFFSGIGGFRLGMELAGHKCLGHCESDKYAEKSYRAMHNVKDGEWFGEGPDAYFDRAASVCSNSQLYKQAGNGVIVPVIYEIARKLI